MDADIAALIAREVVEATLGGPPRVVATLIRVSSDREDLLGAKMLLRPDGSRLGSLDGGLLEEAVAADGLSALTAGQRRAVQALHYTVDGRRVHRLEAQPHAGYQVMMEMAESLPVLLIVGAGHIGQSLAKIGAHVGFSVAVLDDRPDYANRERFPDAHQVLCADLVDSLRSFPITPNTSIVLVSRGHKQDELSLREVVTSEAGYVGMIGSRRRVSAVLQHLANEGFPIEALEGVRTPIGLDIGAETPEEIAVSIIAEIIQARRGGSRRPMSAQRRAKIRSRASGRAP